MAVRQLRPYEGLINRVYEIFSIVDLLPYEMSDEELEGVARLLPSDLQKTMRAFLVPRVRRASLDFLKAVKTWLDGAHRAKREGRKVLLVPFNFPPEIVHCFEGAWPITSEVLSTLGVAALEGQGERYWDYAMGLGLPDFACSANMIEVGSCLTESDFTPDAVISDCFASCDINSKTHEFLARHLGIPLFFLEKTVDNTERGIRQYYRYFHALIRELEEFLGEELDEERMRRVIENANRATELYWELWDLHKFAPCPVPNAFSLMTYGIRYTMWGTEEAVKVMRSMVETSKERLEKGEYPAPEEVARSLWTYTSYYFDMAGLFNWMEENGITHLGDGLDLLFPQVIDTSSRETMLEGLAEIARNMPMTRQMGAPSMSVQWLEDITWAARELNADCCIYCGHHSCKQTWSAASMVRNELMKRAGIPTLVLQGDSWIRRMTPIETLQELIEEFVDNVVRRKGRRAARAR
ncbi:2-hydroxyacyl-CoA dehydratase family protein [Candidatus Solincola tengchongensis]|uniref:2-hydroxyacyl-CoA dehydratase family protein n=1 Tax=Candidatus Solincola tengchongensis TaxID=2900693 RepID=UPI00257F9543|nr:2-hydroxyacyl-CoA dehydratase family protein [Candidatus Solincola tengchongensis]